MAPPKKSTLPKKLPDNFEVTDTEKKKWRLGRLIGEGGFGLIYLASQDVNRPVPEDTDFVIKVEYQENGPLFSELKFYQRAAKPESMAKWKKGKKLDFLGIPTYWGSGLAEHGDLRYRFMVMDRLGSDLQKVFKANGGRLMKDTVLQLGQRLVDVLEYIHENEYVHADIKAANLMLGHRDPEQVYLADYGLSYRYCPNGVHKEYKENPRKGHNGTIEYTSLDAHKGVAPSRRGDLQILGFCLLHWLCGSLPWDTDLKSPTKVQDAKTWLMDNLPDSVEKLSENGGEVASFLLYLTTLGYRDKPDYQRLRELLGSAARGPLDFSRPGTPAGSAARAKKPGKARGPSRTRPGPPEADHQEPNRVKSKPVPERYIRGPPITKAQSQQKEDSPPAARSLRPRTSRSYREESESEEEDARSEPIASCYLWGPPSSPRAPPKQRTKPRRTSRNQTTETSERQEHQVQPHRRDPTWTQSGREPALSSSRPELDERFPHHRPGLDERFLHPRLGLDERFLDHRPGLDERFSQSRPGLDERFLHPRLGLGESFPQPRPGLDERFPHHRPGLDERFLHHKPGLDERFPHHRPGPDERFPHHRPGPDERFLHHRPGLSQQQQLCYEQRGSCGEPEGSVHRDWSPEATASRTPRLKSWMVCLSVLVFGVLCLEFAKVHLNPFKERNV